LNGTQALEERLIEIRERIDVMIHLLLAPVQATEPNVRGKVQREVLKLCDFAHTREEIAKKLKISLNLLDVTLNKLRNKNFIRSVQVSGKTYYIRIR
jgi:transcription initiation factor IIE alpha subunit